MTHHPPPGDHQSALDALRPHLTPPADEKTVVDRPLTCSPRAAVEGLQGLRTPEERAEFADACFAEPGAELQAAEPADWTPEPPARLKQLADPALARFAADLHARWPALTKRCRVEDPRRSSLLPLPRPMVLPGGRFTELYYWDTYWTLRGLLVSGCPGAARDLVDNLVHMAGLTDAGFVPNGSRAYYLGRSQPPLLSEMVVLLADAGAADAPTLRRWTLAIEREQAFWDGPRRSVAVRGGHRLARYGSDGPAAATPRPESRAADEALRAAAGAAPGSEAAARLFGHVRAAAESGWDFSTRWCRDGATLATICTADIVPADLNCFLYRMELNLARLHAEDDGRDKWRAAAARRAAAVAAVLWDGEAGCWRDYDLSAGEQRRQGEFASNYVGLWAGIAPSPEVAAAAVRALGESPLLTPVGVAVSAQAGSGLQWDYPNCWAPLQDLIVEGLRNNGAEALARDLAARWLANVHAAYERDGVIYEKYSAAEPGFSGHGGEYEPQMGFGWTNGVALWTMASYPGILLGGGSLGGGSSGGGSLGGGAAGGAS